MNIWQFFSGKRTHLTGLLALVLCFGQWQDWWKLPAEVYGMLFALAIVFLRAGVSNASQSQNDGSVRIQNLLMPLFAPLAALLLTSGCGTFTVKTGADPVVVWGEYSQEMALDTFDQFLAWERNNETALLKLSPGIHDLAERVRKDGPGWINELDKAVRKYKQSRAPDDLKALLAAQIVLSTAVNQARTYLVDPKANGT